MVYFDVPKGLEILGVDNGCQTSMERFKDNKRSAFFGKCLVVLKGTGMLKARAMGMEDSHLIIN
jgi:beta-galactosidase